jgi:hypothetical protein
MTGFTICAERRESVGKTKMNITCIAGRKYHFWLNGQCLYCPAIKRDLDKQRNVESQKRFKLKHAGKRTVGN